MADGADLSIDAGKLAKDSDRLVRDYLTAGTKAVATTTRLLEKRLEAATQSAVPGRLWRAWASRTYPRSGPARNPVGEVFVNGGERTRGAMTFWTQPGAIRGKDGQYLAIPLPAAGARGRTRNLTPGEWERANGQRLQFIYRQGKPSLLVALGGTTNKRSGGYRRLTAGKRGRAAQGRGGANPLASSVVPIFLLLPTVSFRNAVAIEPLVQQAQNELVGEYLALVRQA